MLCNQEYKRQGEIEHVRTVAAFACPALIKTARAWSLTPITKPQKYDSHRPKSNRWKSRIQLIAIQTLAIQKAPFANWNKFAHNNHHRMKEITKRKTFHKYG
jgi:hypothetical protein